MTDNPVLLRNYKDPSSLEENLLFPLAGDKLVHAGTGPKRKKLSPQVGEQLDVLLFQQADRYVAGANKGYLLHVAEAVQYYTVRGKGWEKKLKTEVFAAFME